MSAQCLAGMTRWTASLALALGLHGAAAAFLLARWHATSVAVASGPAILVDFAPAPAAPTVKPRQVPPGPPQPQVQAQPNAASPKPAAKADRKSKSKQEPAVAKTGHRPESKTPSTPVPVKRAVKAEITVPPPQPVMKKPVAKKMVAQAPAQGPTIDVLPPPRPLVTRRAHKPRQRLASRANAPPAAAQRATRAVARAPGASTRNPDAVPNWKSALVAQIERHKHYPQAALARDEHGVARVAFSVDRRGGVHDVRIMRSSGSALLDRDALAWLRRSQPLPPPPPEMSGPRIRVVVPLRYDIH